MAHGVATEDVGVSLRRLENTCGPHFSRFGYGWSARSPWALIGAFIVFARRGHLRGHPGSVWLCADEPAPSLSGIEHGALAGNRPTGAGFAQSHHLWHPRVAERIPGGCRPGGTTGHAHRCDLRLLRGRYDLCVQRFVDAWESLPGLLLLLTIMSLLGPGSSMSRRCWG